MPNSTPVSRHFQYSYCCAGGYHTCSIVLKSGASCRKDSMIGSYNTLKWYCLRICLFNYSTLRFCYFCIFSLRKAGNKNLVSGFYLELASCNVYNCVHLKKLV